MPRTIDEEAVEFLLHYVARTGDNPAHHQARGFLDRIEELDRAEALRVAEKLTEDASAKFSPPRKAGKT